MNKLWTKDFTIITLGTVVSMFGSAVSGFALGLLVLDYTGSTLLYALFMVVYSLPRVIVPLIAGPYVDRYSRTKMIYSLDFISAGFYGVLAVLLSNGLFNYPVLLLLCIVVGTMDSVYQVAYESLYPTLISEGNFTKAYSVSSLIYPLANTIMVPIAGICYNTIGLVPLFAFNAITFLLAAIFETQIKANETHIIHKDTQRFSLKKYAADFREGVNYLKCEKGLMTITMYFFVTMFAYGVSSTLVLPFFRSHTFEISESMSWVLNFVKTEGGLGVAIYTLLMSISTMGRLIGGAVHYKFKYPVGKKFAIALFVYVVLCFTDGAYLYTSIAVMMIANLVSGMLGVTSYNIRISATQNYVDDMRRGRFNGIFQMTSMMGTILGQLLAGALSEVFLPRPMIAAAMALNLIAVWFIMYRNREYVKPIYNRQA
ncbi:MAG: MFS transporter [Clostridia bacterium]